MFGHWSVSRVEGQRAFGGVLLVEDGDGLFPRGELGIVDLAQIKDMALNRTSGSTATFHDAPVSVDLPVLLASMAAQEHRPTCYPEIREPRQGGRSALQRKSLAERVQRVVSEENRRSTGANQRKPLHSSESSARAFGLRQPSSAAAPRCAGFGSIRSAAGCPQGHTTDGSSIATRPWPPRPRSTACPLGLSPARFNLLGVRKGIWGTNWLN